MVYSTAQVSTVSERAGKNDELIMCDGESSHLISVAIVELLMLCKYLRAGRMAREDVRRRRGGSSSEVVLVDDAEIREVLASRLGS